MKTVSEKPKIDDQKPEEHGEHSLMKYAPILRFVTCGSVDDGKSTLIGRLLYDSNAVLEDQFADFKIDSKKYGTQAGELDFALLLDGLEAERAQGITIDVAYRFFNTKNRKFVVADSPGHEQFTRNMVTAASNADLAIILIDSRKGVLTQTKRHTYLCKLLGINEFVLAVNKIDLVNFNEQAFDEIVDEYKEFASLIGVERFTAIPISGLLGDNVIQRSASTEWYSGRTLIEYLENVRVLSTRGGNNSFAMPVQWVNRPHQDFRGFSGRVTSGAVSVGDRVSVLPGGSSSQIKQIISGNKNLNRAVSGDSVTITFDDDIDCSRGQVIVDASHPLDVASQFEMTVIWLDEIELVVGRSYFIKLATTWVSGTLSTPKYQIDVNTLEHKASKALGINSIGVVNVTIERDIAYANFVDMQSLGSCIIVDKFTNQTVGCGLINFALRRSKNIYWHKTEITKKKRASLKNQKPLVIWLTGLSGSGKSTIANLLEKKLYSMGLHTFVLDGDNIRHGLNKDLGFTDADRIENIRRVAEVSKLMTEAGLIVITAFISPFAPERRDVRNMFKQGEFIEVFVDVPLEVAQERDAKGLYKKVKEGMIHNFTGFGSPYEPPTNPDIHLETNKLSAEESVTKIIKYILE